MNRRIGFVWNRKSLTTIFQSNVEQKRAVKNETILTSIPDMPTGGPAVALRTTILTSLVAIASGLFYWRVMLREPGTHKQQGLHVRQTSCVKEEEEDK